MKFVAFDLETATEVPEGVDLRTFRPMQISCAATITENGRLRLWASESTPGGTYAPFMSQEDLDRMLTYLVEAWKDGYDIVTWNGMGFDFPVLADEIPNRRDTCRDLAMTHIDPAFQMLCEKGYMCGLDAAAQGQCVVSKMHEVGGAKAPAMWKQGPEYQELVLQYVAQDVRVTAAVYKAILDRGMIRWITKKGTPSSYRPCIKGERLLTVAEALLLPMPDTSWMTKPLPRSQFVNWAKQ